MVGMAARLVRAVGLALVATALLATPAHAGVAATTPWDPRVKTLAERYAYGGLTGGEVPHVASGELVVVAGPPAPELDDAALVPDEATPELDGAASAPGAGSSIPGPDVATTLTLRVEVEQGLPVDAAVFADVVTTTLTDPRGWGADGDLRFVRTDGAADVRIILASPDTVDRLCAPLRTLGQTSCRVEDRVVVNAVRWADGAASFNAAGGSRTEYRAYVLNHEVGHVLGQDHRGCPTPGEPAHVMQQQTLDMDGCTPNGWPNPPRP